MIIYLHHRSSTVKKDAIFDYWYKKKASFHTNVPDSQIKHLVVSEQHTMEEVVARVIQAAGSPLTIWHLLINAHGLPGKVYLGRGLTTSTSIAFKALAPYMTFGGKGILVGSCYAAAAKAGPFGEGVFKPQCDEKSSLTLLMQLSRHTNVPVVGGTDQQLTWQLNGPLVKVFPDGAVEKRAGRIVPWLRVKGAFSR